MKAIFQFKSTVLVIALALGLALSCRKTVEIPVNCPPNSRLAPPKPATNNLSGNFPNLAIQSVGNRASFVMTGIFDPQAKSFLELKGSARSDQNFWLEEDGNSRGVEVRELANTSTTLPLDVVFIVDNSGSMSEESDSVASQMLRFTNFLLSKKLDARFGCVGQFGNVRGALNLNTMAALDKYLTGRGQRGTSRTVGFDGPDAVDLQTKAKTFHQTVTAENSIVAMFFADQHFAWRPGASRVYIVFTDDVTYPGSNATFNNINFQKSWKPDQGTAHVVFSLDNGYWKSAVPDTAVRARWSAAYNRPWELAQFTGGTVKVIHSDCRDLSLIDLPVTQALTSSYLVEFCSSDATKEHALRLTLRTANGASDGSRTYRLTYKPK